MVIMIAMWVLVFLLAHGGRRLYMSNIIEPRRQEEKRRLLEEARAKQLAIETKQAQDAALTLEDKIWLFDMGRTEWSPEDELGFIPEFTGSPCIYYKEHSILAASRMAYVWDLPVWYVDFLSTRPFHSELAKCFYDLACEGKDVKTHIVELKRASDARIAAQQAADEEVKRRHHEWVVEQKRIKHEESEKLRAARIEKEKRLAKERKKRATELEEHRRKMLGLTGDWRDEILRIYGETSFHVWNQVSDGKRVVSFAPGSDRSLAVKELQKTFGLPISGVIDRDTLREIEVQFDVDKYIKKSKLHAVS